MPFVNTNILELEQHMKKFAGQMFQSEELVQAGKQAQVIMMKNVSNRVNSNNPYDYDQSGAFKRLIRTQKDGFVQSGRTSLKVGFGDLTDMNDTIYMRPEQEHTIRKSQGYLSITTKAEREMPKWIVLEFGTRGKGDKLPKQFNVSYTKRPDKQALMGPSSLLANESKREHKRASEKGVAPDPTRLYVTRNAGGFHNKNTYFMASDEASEWAYNGSIKRHPGTKAGRFFRGGLQDSKQPIYDTFSSAIHKYLQRMNH